MAAIWDVESLVDPNDGVEIYHNDLDGEIEEVEACLGIVPGWIGARSRNIIGTCSECGAKGEQRGGEEQDKYLASESSMSELLDWWSVRKDNSEEHQGDWKKSCNGEVSPSDQLHVPVDAPDVVRKRVEGLDRAGDQCYEHQNDRDVV